jgi:hypothetical protein
MSGARDYLKESRKRKRIHSLMGDDDENETMLQDETESSSSQTVIDFNRRARRGRDEANLEERTLGYWEKKRLWSLKMMERFRTMRRDPEVSHVGIEIDPSQWPIMALWRDLNQLCNHVSPLCSEVRTLLCYCHH